MLHVRNILYPTDLSDNAAHAFGLAVQLASVLGATLHAMYVTIPAMDDPDERELEDQLLPAEPPGHIQVIKAIRKGDSASSTIIQYARHNEIDLIVMGTHGRTGLGRLFVGSVAETVVRGAGCPVLTVPQRAPSATIGHIVAAVDFSDHSETTLRHAAAFAEALDARLSVVHVLQDIALPSVYGPEVAPIVTPSLQRRSEEALHELVESVIKDDLPVDSQILLGYPAMEILRYAEQKDVGLIVMASHGLSGIEHFLIGSVTEKVVRKACCPVLTVRPTGKSLTSSS